MKVFENKSPFPRAITIKEGAIHVYQEGRAGRCDVTINCKVCHIIIKFNEPPPLSPSWHPSDCVNVSQAPFQPIRGQDCAPDQLDVRTRGQDGADAGHYLTQYCDDQAR